ncbi:GNAT family N-acetyltransferase [Limobrevibacterium gyesilva]|uniref:GNAT family N-acetyltransferase n=1 Tax=Limobrevibacterium gyesilva TaxID=2991712 RepID=A0AA41YJE8_9PROT|nr:GNAT family N-acetyltransferase [Limobrevibacterium gyesilva]MCW3473152.1 GNAT family N-acetyltransferase [Limobrevibacterium gyesilva]
MDTRIVGIADRPDLVPVIAKWLWHEWGRREGRTLASTTAWLQRPMAALGPEQVFILLAEGAPAGTASLVHDDLDERRELTPWLASVYVPEAYRGRGYAARLVRRVEAACMEAGIATLWLHTEHAAALYARLGWQEAGAARDHGHPVSIMRRDFG